MCARRELNSLMYEGKIGNPDVYPFTSYLARMLRILTKTQQE